jgi:hypothetical protein
MIASKWQPKSYQTLPLFDKRFVIKEKKMKYTHLYALCFVLVSSMHAKGQNNSCIGLRLHNSSGPI